MFYLKQQYLKKIKRHFLGYIFKKGRISIPFSPKHLKMTIQNKQAFSKTHRFPSSEKNQIGTCTNIQAFKIPQY